MKHFFTSIFMLLSTLSAVAQFQLANNDFELWDSNNEPTYWNSYPTAGGTLGGLVKSNAQIFPVDRSTDNKCVQIKARSVIGIIANGMLTTGQIQGNSTNKSDPSNCNLSAVNSEYCMKFTGKPDSMSVLLKASYPAAGQLTRLYVVLHEAADVTDPATDFTKVVAVAGKNVPQSSDWARISVPFYYKGETLKIYSDNKGTSTLTDCSPSSSQDRPSFVLASISTNYMAGQGNKNDVLYIDDAIMIYNSRLKSVKVNGVALAGFNKDTYTYKVSGSYTEGCVVAEADGRGATLSTSYDATAGVCTITVKGDDYSINPSNTHQYKIQFVPDKVYESWLTALNINGSSIPNFVSGTTAYTVSTMSYNNVKVTYTASEGATVTESFDAATNVLTLTVKGSDFATNSANVHVYKITFHAPFESLMTSLTVNGAAISPVAGSTDSYVVNSAAYSTSTVTCTTSVDATAEKSFDATTNVLTITVKGGDYATNSKNVHTYKVTFHAPFEAFLTSLKVNGASVANFSSSTTTYRISDAAFATSKVEYTASAEATVTESFNASTNVLTLTVKGGDIATNARNYRTYRITFHAPFESVLTTLTVNGVSVANFSSSTYSYMVSDAAYATSKVEYTASTGATVTTAYDDTKDVLTITVKGGDFATNSANVHTYTIAFHAPFESVLTSLKVNGASVANFSSATAAYAVKDAAYATSIVEYTASAEATVEKSFDAATNVLTLTVKGGDVATNSTNIHTYTVTFHAPFESLLTSLKVNGASVANFSSATKNYQVDDAAYSTSTVEYTASAEATVEKSFDPTTNIMTLTVKGGDYATNNKNVNVYTVAFHADFGAYLVGLNVNGAAIADFAPNQFKYVVKDAAYATSTVQFDASAGATVTDAFDPATNVLTITVKGADIATNPSNVNVYEVTFHAPFSSVLTALTVNGAAPAGFSSEVLKYNYDDAAYATSKVLYTASEEAKVTEQFDPTTNVLTLTVMGGDYATNKQNVHVYTIGFHASFDSYLTALSVNGKSVDQFGATTYAYLCPTDYETAKVEYTASAEAQATHSFDPATHLLSITVKGGDIATNAENIHVYKVQFYASSHLADLKVDGATVAGFDRNKMEYSIDVTREFSTLVYAAEDQAATVVESYDEVSAVLTITVSGSDVANYPDNVHVYKVQYHLPYTSFLASLSNNGVALSDFSATKFEYVVDEVYARSTIKYTADEYTTVEESFDAATNVLSITVKGGDVDINPTNLHVYKVQFHAPYTSFLSSLSINETVIEGFAPDKFEYVVDDVYFKVALGVVADQYATYSMKYDAKSYVLTIRVEAGDIALDPKNFHEYKIQFNDHNVYNSQLLNVVINGAPMELFDKDAYVYDVEGSYADLAFAFTADSLTSITEDFDPIANVLKVTVSGGNIEREPTNFHTYEFTFSVQFSFGAQITAIYYDGVAQDWFDKDTYEYTVDMDFNRAHFTYTTNSLADVYEFFDSEDLTLSVVVIGGDMDYSNMSEYTIHFSSTSSVKDADNEIVSLSYADGTIWLRDVTEGNYSLFSLKGHLLRSGKIDGASVEVGELAHGVYLFRLNGQTLKFLVR